MQQCAASARVSIFSPSQNGWQAEPAVEPAWSDENGQFKLLIDREFFKIVARFFGLLAVLTGRLRCSALFPLI